MRLLLVSLSALCASIAAESHMPIVVSEEDALEPTIGADLCMEAILKCKAESCVLPCLKAADQDIKDCKASANFVESDVHRLQLQVGCLESELKGTKHDMDQFFLVLGGALVFFMHPGFALLEAGSVRSKNTKAILTKNFVNVAIAGLVFWLVGFSFAMGDNGNKFIGASHWALGSDFKVAHDEQPGTPFDGYKFGTWFFQWAFAATAATIVSGAVAERMNFHIFLIYTVVTTGFTYPVIAHWGWHGDGWASIWVSGREPLFNAGLIDFAGCGVVHLTGAVSALVAIAIIGPRAGRFVNKVPDSHSFHGHSPLLQVVGVFFLWFGWYGFNCFSMLKMSGGSGASIARIAVNTTVSGAAGTLTSLLLTYLLQKDQQGRRIISLEATINGSLAGLVSITSAAASVEPWAAWVIGMVGAFVYLGLSYVVLCVAGLDDVVDAVAVHGGCGIWGLIAAACFTTQELHALVFGKGDAYGLFYGGGGRLLGVAMLFVLAVFAWAGGMMALILLACKAVFRGSFVPTEAEQASGADLAHHGGSASPELANLLATLEDMDFGFEFKKRYSQRSQEVGLSKHGLAHELGRNSSERAASPTETPSTGAKEC